MREEMEGRVPFIARNEIFIPWFLLHTSISFLWFPSLQRGEGMLNVRGTGTHTSLGLLPPLTSGVRWFLEVRQFFQEIFPVGSLVRAATVIPLIVSGKSRMQKKDERENSGQAFSYEECLTSETEMGHDHCPLHNEILNFSTYTCKYMLQIAYMIHTSSYTSVTLVLQSQRQEDRTLEASFSFVTSRPQKRSM